MVESFTKSMQGPRPTSDDVKALIAYLDTLEYPRNPYTRSCRRPHPPAAERGKVVYRSAKAACNTCHGGPELTDGKIHDGGLEEPDDAYRGYNPPSLRGLYDKDPYLHDGRSKTLRSPRRPPQRRRRLGPGRTDRGRACRSAGILEDALMAKSCRTLGAKRAKQ